MPSVLAPGGSAAVRIRVLNNGATTWREGTSHRLGAWYGDGSNQVTWSGFPCGGYMLSPTDGRVFLCGDVPPGATYDFNFNVTVPAGATGSVRLGVRMVQDGLEWFGQTFSWTITVSSGGGCPCSSDPNVNNYCHYTPGTPGCGMTFPGGYCDPNGDGSYADADWVRGYYEYQANCSAPPPPSLPDVTVTDLTWTPTNPQVGDSVQFHATVTNQADVATPADVGVGFSVGGFSGWGIRPPMQARETAVISLDAGPSGNRWVPSSSGTFTVTATADDVNRFQESNENNNARSAQVAVGGGPLLPDVTITNLTWTPTNLQVGDSVQFHATVTNQADVATTADVGVGFSVAGFSGWGIRGPMQARETTVISLDAGPAGNRWIPSSSGTFTLTAAVDDINRFPESNENNNTLSAQVTVGGGPPPLLPDVTITDLTWTPASPRVGDSVQFHATVTNQADVATPADVGVGFSVGGFFGWGIRPPMQARETAVINLEAGPSGNRWIAPSSGTFTVTATADDINRFQESNEDNNARSAQVTVGGAPSARNKFGVGMSEPGNTTLWDRARDLVGPEGWVLMTCAEVTAQTTGASGGCRDGVREITNRGQNVIVRLGSPWPPQPPWGPSVYAIRNDADPGSNNLSYDNLAQTYRRVVEDLLAEMGSSPRKLVAQIGNELNLCYEWITTGPDLPWTTMAHEIAAFHRDVGDALAGLTDPRLVVVNAPLAPGGPGLCRADGTYDGGVISPDFIREMAAFVPGLFGSNRFDGFASHPYPAAAIGSNFFVPFDQASIGLHVYRDELAVTGNASLPAYLTETGWPSSGEGYTYTWDEIGEMLVSAWTSTSPANLGWFQDSQVVAVTPFQLNWTNDWDRFAWLEPNNSTPRAQYNRVRSARCARVGGPDCTTAGLVVNPGATVSVAAAVPTDQAEASFSTSWPGSDVVMTLRSPSGRIIGRDSAAPDVTHRMGPTYEEYVISGPEAGGWQVDLFGADVAPGGEEVRFSLTTLATPPPDLTPPVIVPSVTGTQGAQGWYTSDVEVSWTVGDPETGIASSSGCETTRLVTDTPEITLTCSATNGRGLPASASLTLKLDKTAPRISIASPQTRPYLPTGAVAVTWTASDATSGLASDVATLDGSPLANGQLVDLSLLPPGPHSVAVTASDAAGVSATASVGFAVVDEAHTAQHLDWPLGTCDGPELVLGRDVDVLQNFANATHPRFGPRQHAGLDLRLPRGGTTNAAVYGAAEGVVHCTNAEPGDVRPDYPGRVVVLAHILPDGHVYYSLYGHLGEVRASKGQWVRRGEPIGTILDQDQEGNSHLHFEVREFGSWAENDCAGPGYAPEGSSAEADGWIDPVTFYYTHRPPYPAGVLTWSDEPRSVRARPSPRARRIGSLPPSSRITARAVVPDASCAEAAPCHAWWYRVRHDRKWGYVNGFLKGPYGSTLAVGEPGRVGPDWRRPHERPLIEYRFDGPDEFARGIARNSGHRGRFDGAIRGLAQPAPGLSGRNGDRALGLDGETAHVEVEDSERARFGAGLRLEAYLWRESNQSEDAIAGQWYGDDRWLLTFYPEGNGKLILTVRLQNGEYASVDYHVPDCTYLRSWVHVAASYDPRSGLHLYWNGTQVARKELLSAGLAPGTGPIHIGDAGNDWSRFHGRIDDVRIWARGSGPRP